MNADPWNQIVKSKKELAEYINTFVDAITEVRRDYSSINDLLRNLLFIVVVCVTADVERKEFRKRSWPLKSTCIPVF